MSLSASTTPWSRLQSLSCEHALRLWVAAGRPKPSRYIRSLSNHVPETIQENVEILCRGDEEEIKYRVLWYITYYPEIFDVCSKKEWKLI